MTESKAHLVIVDDDRDIREPLGRYFRRSGYRVTTAANGSELDRVLATSVVDLIVLDIMMPGEDGFAICRRLQANSHVPTILLTAIADEADRIVGLELGADDYVCKPFNPRELLARVKSVLRRTEMLPPRHVRSKGRVSFDHWTFDFGRKEVFGPDKVGVRLSTGEYLLLTTLIEHAGMTLTRDQLLDLTRGREVQLFDRSIDMQISRLSRKLEADPKSPQIIAVLALAFAVLLAVLTVAEQTEPGGLSATAESSQTTARITRLSSVLARIKPGEIEEFVSAESLCHFGYEISDAPYAARVDADTEAIATSLAHTLKMEPGAVVVGRATLAQTDFGYGKCPPDVIAFPVEGLVISTRLPDGRWLHAEIHPHEPHFQSTFANRFQRLTLAFVIVAGIAALFMYRLGKPLRLLTEGAIRFGKGLKVESLAEAGPPDLRRTIGAFNAMQQQVTEEVARRTNTLAALSHDLRTPLTALRVKAELVDDENVRADLIQSIRKMEAISASAIEFLQGEARTEPMRVVDLAALAESECADFEEIGATVHFAGEHKPVLCTCRPEAVSRALRNLIDNAVKYGGSASVTVRKMPAAIVLAVSDQGPGIAPDQIGHAIEPFVRLSPARENETGGFGLGLAVAKSVAEGHDGTLVLSPNTPHGLIASITIPSS